MWEPVFLSLSRTAMNGAVLSLVCTLVVSPFGLAQTSQTDLTQVSIEDLMKVEVTSVSRHEQSLSQIAAGVFVISAEDIQRSGATNIPDLLRMVPGVQVASINSNAWAVSVRGFNGRFANKVLVMVDGRTVYVPSFGAFFMRLSTYRWTRSHGSK